jgi:hypothetical protein
MIRRPIMKTEISVKMRKTLLQLHTVQFTGPGFIRIKRTKNISEGRFLSFNRVEACKAQNLPVFEFVQYFFLQSTIHGL